MRFLQLLPLLNVFTLVNGNTNKTERSIGKRDIFADVNRLQAKVQAAVQVVVIQIQHDFQAALSQAGVNIYLPGEIETGLLFTYFILFC